MWLTFWNFVYLILLNILHCGTRIIALLLSLSTCLFRCLPSVCLRLSDDSRASHGFYSIWAQLVPALAIYLCHKIISKLEQRPAQLSLTHTHTHISLYISLYIYFKFVKVCNNFSRFWRWRQKMRFNILRPAKNCSWKLFVAGEQKGAATARHCTACPGQGVIMKYAPANAAALINFMCFHLQLLLLLLLLLPLLLVVLYGRLIKARFVALDKLNNYCWYFRCNSSQNSQWPGKVLLHLLCILKLLV